MTVADLQRNSIAVRSGMNFSAFPVVELKNGNVGVQGLRIFRAGTFKDSLGIQRTWEKTHLAQMVSNFQMLRDEGKFTDVPVREDHSYSIQKVVGYFQDIRVDDTFLVADVEFTVPDAKEKIDRGHWRARSLEVGAYETNEESLYWPVVMGLAFVDIGAVEGLHSQPRAKGDLMQRFSQIMQDEDKEIPVADDNTNTGTGEGTGNTTPPAPTPPTPPAEPSTPAPTPPAPPAEGTPAPATGEGDANHGRPAGGTHTFSVNGQTTSDFGAVQRHIDSLEAFRRETVEAGRRDFVSGLASSNRIVATQVESLTAHALSLSDEQFAAFRTAYEGAPANSLLANHGNPGGGDNTAPGTDKVSDEISVLEETVAMHKRSGMNDEALQKTSSYKRLQQLKSSGTAA